MDIVQMLFVVLCIPNPMVRKPSLPNFRVASQFLFARYENPPLINCTARSNATVKG